MTTDTLTWPKAKDAILVSLAGGLLACLGLLLKGQAESNATLAEVKRDLAVIASEARRDREEIVDLKSRVRLLENRRASL